MRRFLNSYIVCFILFGTLLQASDLNDYIKLVLKKNVLLKLAQKELDLAKYSLDLAWAGFEPHLNLSGRFDLLDPSFSHDNYESSGLLQFEYIQQFESATSFGIKLSQAIDDYDGSTDYATRLNLSFSQSLVKDFLGLNHRNASLLAAELRFLSEKIRFNRSKELIVYKAKEYFYNWISLNRKISILNSTISDLRTFRKQLRDTKYPHRALVSQRFLSLYHQLEAKYKDLLFQRNKSLSLLRSWVGFSTLYTDYEPSYDTFYPLSFLSEEEVDLYLDINVDNNFTLQVGQQSLELAKVRVQQRENDFLPSLDLEGTLSYASRDLNNNLLLPDFDFANPSFRLGLTSNIPVHNPSLSLLKKDSELLYDRESYRLTMTKTGAAKNTFVAIDHVNAMVRIYPDLKSQSKAFRDEFSILSKQFLKQSYSVNVSLFLAIQLEELIVNGFIKVPYLMADYERDYAILKAKLSHGQL